MAITILAVGKTKKGFIQDGISEYLKRAKKYTVIKLVELPDYSAKNSDINSVKENEADVILKRIKPSDFFILLDSKGKHQTTLDFADYLQTNLNKNLVFCIGGVYGVSPRITKRSNFVLSFSKMTFTHQMIRMMLIEQIYRALNLKSGGNYHKE